MFLTLYRKLFSQLRLSFREMETILFSCKNTLTQLNPALRCRGVRCPTWHLLTGPTCHELSKRLGARGRDGQSQLVDGNPVGHGQAVDPFVRSLAGEQLPEQDAIAAGEHQNLFSRRLWFLPIFVAKRDLYSGCLTGPPRPLGLGLPPLVHLCSCPHPITVCPR